MEDVVMQSRSRQIGNPNLAATCDPKPSPKILTLIHQQPVRPLPQSGHIGSASPQLLPIDAMEQRDARELLHATQTTEHEPQR
eukprot:CAMPEP_0183361042 /NCGR_PEP_ID=MMETSP0164_2-20130417/56216_1 /TAXON_ID=221442 /ORGANISM="Coccolithus pelagicus ssp braarudi, Strain PLY182g" /LENGTH=82 /DNA_ID=CAMNT_0025535495 /DNA_START=156 /DNA_END=401 /DNA_ORIENTATION=-